MHWKDMFQFNQSPYFACFHAGLQGASERELEARAAEVGIRLRQKDWRNYDNGRAVSHKAPLTLSEILRTNPYGANAPVRKQRQQWSDMATLPADWCGFPRCWFPCDTENKPLLKWGSVDGRVDLLTYEDAKARAPYGWVGRNLYMQPIVVLDIDSYHGEGVDTDVLEWGNKFKHRTLCYENPAKPGSYHLVFATNRLVRTQHYPYAHFDLLGNASNQSEGLKNKLPNGIPAEVLTENIYMEILRYAQSRKDLAVS